MRVAFVDTDLEWNDLSNVIFQSLIRLRENVSIDNLNPDLCVTRGFSNASSESGFIPLSHRTLTTRSVTLHLRTMKTLTSTHTFRATTLGSTGLTKRQDDTRTF